MSSLRPLLFDMLHFIPYFLTVLTSLVMWLSSAIDEILVVKSAIPTNNIEMLMVIILVILFVMVVVKRIRHLLLLLIMPQFSA